MELKIWKRIQDPIIFGTAKNLWSLLHSCQSESHVLCNLWLNLYKYSVRVDPIPESIYIYAIWYKRMHPMQNKSRIVYLISGLWHIRAHKMDGNGIGWTFVAFFLLTQRWNYKNAILKCSVLIQFSRRVNQSSCTKCVQNVSCGCSYYRKKWKSKVQKRTSELTSKERAKVCRVNFWTE